MTTNSRQRFDRAMWRAAAQITDCLNSGREEYSDGNALHASWQNWQTVQRKLRSAEQRSWTGAQRRLQQDALCALSDLSIRLDQRRRMMRNAVDDPGMPARETGAIYRDLVSLRDEFVDVSCHVRSRRIAAVTDAIVLEGIDLGPFEIVLSWNSHSVPSDYEVRARAPRPAASSEHVVHPHVDRNQLCAGDGRSAITAALQEGRLADFFLIVQQVLQTYNPDSAYVTLRNWYGRVCPDCNDWLDEDEEVCCSDCESIVCGACARDCDVCGSSICGDCPRECPECSQQVCVSCFPPCAQCKESFCEDCLDERLCPRCRKTEETSPEARPVEAGGSHAAVHAVRVGQAAVSARCR